MKLYSTIIIACAVLALIRALENAYALGYYVAINNSVAHLHVVKKRSAVDGNVITYPFRARDEAKTDTPQE